VLRTLPFSRDVHFQHRLAVFYTCIFPGYIIAANIISTLHLIIRVAIPLFLGAANPGWVCSPAGDRNPDINRNNSAFGFYRSSD